VNNDLRQILASLDKFNDSAEAVAEELRSSVSMIILRELRARGWSQKKLSDESGFRQPHISRIIHGNDNCTLETIARILFSLGLRGRIDTLVPNQAETEPLSATCVEGFMYDQEITTISETVKQEEERFLRISHGDTDTAGSNARVIEEPLSPAALG